MADAWEELKKLVAESEAARQAAVQVLGRLVHAIDTAEIGADLSFDESLADARKLVTGVEIAPRHRTAEANPLIIEERNGFNVFGTGFRVVGPWRETRAEAHRDREPTRPEALPPPNEEGPFPSAYNVDVPPGQWAVRVLGGLDLDWKTMFVSGVQSFEIASYPSDGDEDAQQACGWFATQFRAAMKNLGAPPEMTEQPGPEAQPRDQHDVDSAAADAYDAGYAAAKAEDPAGKSLHDLLVMLADMQKHHAICAEEDAIRGRDASEPVDVRREYRARGKRDKLFAEKLAALLVPGGPSLDGPCTDPLLAIDSRIVSVLDDRRGHVAKLHSESLCPYEIVFDSGFTGRYKADEIEAEPGNARSSRAEAIAFAAAPLSPQSVQKSDVSVTNGQGENLDEDAGYEHSVGCLRGRFDRWACSTQGCVMQAGTSKDNAGSAWKGCMFHDCTDPTESGWLLCTKHIVSEGLRCGVDRMCNGGPSCRRHAVAEHAHYQELRDYSGDPGVHVPNAAGYVPFCICHACQSAMAKECGMEPAIGSASPRPCAAWPTSDEGDTHTRLQNLVDSLGTVPTTPIAGLLTLLEERVPALVAEAADNLALLARGVELFGEEPAPVPMFLTCPKCNARHIDEGDFAMKRHHTHSCQACGLTWRPAVAPTVGVAFLPGFKNESPGPSSLGAEDDANALTNPSEACVAGQEPAPRGSSSDSSSADPEAVRQVALACITAIRTRAEYLSTDWSDASVQTVRGVATWLASEEGRLAVRAALAVTS